MVMPDPFVKIDVKNSVTNWLINFEEAINQNNADAASLLFVEDGHWRWHAASQLTQQLQLKVRLINKTKRTVTSCRQ